MLINKSLVLYMRKKISDLLCVYYYACLAILVSLELCRSTFISIVLYNCLIPHLELYNLFKVGEQIWIKVNVEQTGFYEVKYDDVLATQLKDRLYHSR
ncbi:hypothetical protein Syun_009081 [Stephania yunnanensis]|uniref:Uncharacterized protein n=1 Tax=Stephania yunnanensis TaxID=152371 RepID=A0AAP0PNQ4_9MAGN